MLSLLDIKQALNAALRRAYPKEAVYFDHIDKAKMPYFYVEFTAIHHTPLDEAYTEKLLQIDVTYCPNDKREVKRADLFAMADELDRALRPVLQVKDRALTLQDIEITVHDDVLHYIFNLDFADAFESEETHEPMKEMTMDWR